MRIPLPAIVGALAAAAVAAAFLANGYQVFVIASVALTAWNRRVPFLRT